MSDRRDELELEPDRERSHEAEQGEPIGPDSPEAERGPSWVESLLDRKEKAGPEAERSDTGLVFKVAVLGVGALVVMFVLFGWLMSQAMKGRDADEPSPEAASRGSRVDASVFERLRSASSLPERDRAEPAADLGEREAAADPRFEAALAAFEADRAAWSSDPVFMKGSGASSGGVAGVSGDLGLAGLGLADDLEGRRAQAAETLANYRDQVAKLTDTAYGASNPTTTEAFGEVGPSGEVGLRGGSGVGESPSSARLEAPTAASSFRLDDELPDAGIVRAKRLATPRWALPPGSQIETVLMTDYDSSQPSLVVGQVRRPVYSRDGAYVLIPAGTLVLGESSSSLPGQARSGYGRMEALVFPDKTVVEVPSWAPTDTRGRAGIPGKANHHLWKAFGAATLLGVVSGVFADATDTGTVAFGQVPTQEHISSETAREYQALANRILDRYVNLPVTIEASAGTRMMVLVQQTFDLGEPWGRAE